VNSPLPLVVAELENLVESSTTSTLALGTTAFWGSVTMPVIIPELICAAALAARKVAARTTRKRHRA
jgi:hypothetical protein